MFKNLFKFSSSTEQSFSDSKDSFSQVGSSAYNLASHTYNALDAAWNVADQAFKATMAGGFASVIGAGLFVASSVLMPVGIASAAVGGVGYFLLTNPLTMIVGANVVSFVNNSESVTNFASNSTKAVVDAVSVPYYAAKGLFQTVVGTGEAVHDVVDNAAKIIRTPDQTETNNANGPHSTTIDGKEFDSILTEVNIKSELGKFITVADSNVTSEGSFGEELNDIVIIGDAIVAAAA